MRWWGKRGGVRLSVRQEQAAGKIAARILRGQRALANRLNRRTAGFSQLAWLLLLIMFCLLFGTYCLSLLFRVF